MSSLPSLIARLCTTLLTVATTAYAGTTYTITGLGQFHAGGINNAGQISGSCSGVACIYNNGSMTYLGTLGGSSNGNDINAGGQVVGASSTSTNSNEYHAFLYSNGVITDLGTFGGVYSMAGGINDGGQIAGYATFANGDMHAFLYSNGVMSDLGTLGGSYSAAWDINNYGEVVGDSFGQAFLYSNGAMTGLGDLGGNFSRAHGINDNGQIVGVSITGGGSDQFHAFLYQNGTMVDLGAPTGKTHSEATAINNSGQVVGYAYSIGQDFDRAFLYSNGAMLDLNNLIDPNSGWQLNYAWDINDSGQIIGYGLINGQGSSFLLTPTAVPLPAAVWLLGSGLLGLIGFGRRKKINRN